MAVFCDMLKWCSTAALDCRTGQKKSRYRKKELLFLLVSLSMTNRSYNVRFSSHEQTNSKPRKAYSERMHIKQHVIKNEWDLYCLMIILIRRWQLQTELLQTKHQYSMLIWPINTQLIFKLLFMRQNTLQNILVVGQNSWTLF